MIREILGEKISRGNKCYLLGCKLIIIQDFANNTTGNIVSLKILVDPKHNFLFPEFELEILGPYPEYLIREYSPFEIIKVYDIEYVEVMPDFFLPKSGKVKFIKKEANGGLSIKGGYKIDIIYKGINLNLSKEDFWFTLQSNLPIYNDLYKIRGNDLQDYQQKLAEFKDQFKK